MARVGVVLRGDLVTALSDLNHSAWAVNARCNKATRRQFAQHNREVQRIWRQIVEMANRSAKKE